MESNLLKLNLRRNPSHLEGYSTVDFSELEVTPWPWPSGSVGEIRLNTVLNYISNNRLYYDIVKELYRVCAPEALIYINAVHPEHPLYYQDSKYVRPITAKLLFELNKDPKVIEGKIISLPPAHWLDVDFVMLQNLEFSDPSGAVYENQFILKARKTI